MLVLFGAATPAKRTVNNGAFRSHAISKATVLDGIVCTISLHIISKGPKGVPHPNALEELKPTLKREFQNSVTDVLGPTFAIDDLTCRDASRELVIEIRTTSYKLRDYQSLANALQSLGSHLADLLVSRLGEKGFQVKVKATWTPAPSLIRFQLKVSRRSLFAKLQQPLGLLVVATLLGSGLIPYFNDIENRRKLRHEERVKIAISILDQTQETDKLMDGMMQYLVLFWKNHKNTSVTESQLEQEQRMTRKTFEERFLAFNAQAWWWPWNVWHKAKLASLATPAESEQILRLTESYLNALDEGNQAFPILWDPFLRDKYLPGDPNYETLITRSMDTLEKARVRRNNFALEMARIFAGN